jgi:hypothetical protein
LVRRFGRSVDDDGDVRSTPDRLAEADTAPIFGFEFWFLTNQRLAAAGTTGEKKWASK